MPVVLEPARGTATPLPVPCGRPGCRLRWVAITCHRSDLAEVPRLPATGSVTSIGRYNPTDHRDNDLLLRIFCARTTRPHPAKLRKIKESEHGTPLLAVRGELPTASQARSFVHCFSSWHKATPNPWHGRELQNIFSWHGCLMTGCPSPDRGTFTRRLEASQ